MRIPRGPSVVSNRQTSTGDVSSIQTSNAVANFSGVADVVDSYLEKEASAKTLEKTVERERKINEWKQKNFERTGAKAEGLTEEFDSFVKQLDSDIVSSTGKRTKEKYQPYATRANEQERAGVMAFQHQQALGVRKNAFEDSRSFADETIRQDAKSWQKAKEIRERGYELALASGVLSQEEFERTKTEDDNRFRQELGKNYYTQDKHDFMKNIGQMGFGKPEIAAYKQRYENDLAAEERERKSLFSEEAKLLMSRKDDMKAQALANADTSHFFDSAQKLEKMGYKEWATELREEGNLYKNVVDFNLQNKSKPLKEIVSAAQSLKVGDKLEGSSVEMRSRDAIQGEVKKQLKTFDMDPAQYVAGWAQGETMEEIADSRISLQQSQGLFPSKGFQVTTNQERTQFKNAWEAGNSKQKTDLVLESFKYGKHTPQVLDEAGVNSALTLAPILAFDVTTGVNKRDVELLVSGVSSKPEILEDETKAAYTEAAKSSEFYNTLLEAQKRFPTNPDLPRRISDIQNAMTGIGARMVDPGAGAKFFDDRMNSVTSSDKVVYFPKSIDSDELEESLDKKKEEVLKKFQTGDKKNDMSAKWAIRDATWVNTSNGFVLADPRSGAYLTGSEVDMLDLDPLRKDLAKRKIKESEGFKTTLSRR